jgi:hypothetical protein
VETELAEPATTILPLASILTSQAGLKESMVVCPPLPKESPFVESVPLPSSGEPFVLNLHTDIKLAPLTSVQ